MTGEPKNSRAKKPREGASGGEEPKGDTAGRGGRPSSYKPEYARIAKEMCRLGATDSDLADAFDVNVRTIWRWLAAHKEFCQAVRVSKDIADDKVERSLYQRAVGYSYDAVKVFMPSGADKPVYAPYREHVAPDTTACIFWLKNRRKAEWRDKVNHEHTGSDGAPLLPALQVTYGGGNEQS